MLRDPNHCKKVNVGGYSNGNPISAYHGIISDYVEELQEVTTPTQLETFLQKHQVVWEIQSTRFKSWRTRERGRVILRRAFDFNQALADIKQLKQSTYLDELNKFSRIAADIVAPIVLLLTLDASNRFGCPDGTAFHQLWCNDTKHNSCF